MKDFELKNKSVPFVLISLVIALAVFICYSNATDIFFVADDFLWLERARFQITKEPLSIFKSEGLYFDPLIYLFFRINYIFSGLDPAWYHRVDLLIHTINALLVSYLAFLLTQNRVAAFFSGFIFAVSPVNADSVLWPSSRVDTLAAIFYSSSIVVYVLYQRNQRVWLYCLSIIFFIASLSAKITPIMLPFVILFLEMTYNKVDYKRSLCRLIPFIVISTVYLAILLYASPSTIIQTSEGAWRISTMGFLKGVSALFFPDSLIALNETFYISLSILSITLIMIFNMLFYLRACITAFIMIIIIILPLMFLPISFTHATPSAPPYYVLASVGHRIYLGMIGFSIIGGMFVALSLEKLKRIRHGKLLSSIVFGVLALIVFVYGSVYIREREQLWRIQGNEYKKIVRHIKDLKYRDMFKYSKIYFIGSPVSFTQSMFRLYFNNGNLVLEIVENYDQVIGREDGVLRPVDIGS